jgi:DNA-binding NarL/FixJ family response regulator
MRIFLADNHDVLRRGLRHLLTGHPGWVVCGEAKNGKEAVKLIFELRPDIVILDQDLAETNGIEAARMIRQTLPATEILFFTTHEEDYVIAEALRTGARGYVLKSEGEAQIIDAVEALSKHLPFFNPRASEMLLNHLVIKGPQTDGFWVLTDREREIVRLLADGKTNKEVASLLRISVKTVETHRSALMHKLELTSITDLVRYAIRQKLIEP